MNVKYPPLQPPQHCFPPHFIKNILLPWVLNTGNDCKLLVGAAPYISICTQTYIDTHDLITVPSAFRVSFRDSTL